MKYMGSKARISKDIAPIINKMISEKEINTYIEPFVGGCNMIEHIICKNKIASDNNDYLIHMWNDLKNGWTPPINMSREKYMDIRDNKNEYSEALVAIAGFCATYNAKWFGGYAGIVKTKIGTSRNYYDEAIRNIQKQIYKIQDVEFRFGDYKQYSEVKNTLIYCDIPYEGTTQYGTSKRFNHLEFWGWVRNMSKNNIVLISEYNAPDDFKCIYKKQLTTTFDKNSRKKDIEKLFILSDIRYAK
ncbi:DNA adenine methylase [Clostridioides difficile]|nr:DNA adenine methylase [Clostridioides difficile]